MRLRQTILIMSLLLLPGAANAQLALSAGLEYLDWEENVSPPVTEKGWLFTFGVGYTQERYEGLVLAYRGKLWLGSVDYTGATLFTNLPISGTTGYTGLTNEAQVRWRNPMQAGDYSLDLVAGLGIDVWQRELSSVQREDYLVTYVRAGIAADSAYEGTWMYAFGIKYPLWVGEDAHLDRIGFDTNPELNPAGKISLYTHVGYRLRDDWAIVGYVDGYRFGQSNQEQVNEVANGYGPMTVYQPASDMLLIGIRLERSFP